MCFKAGMDSGLFVEYLGTITLIETDNKGGPFTPRYILRTPSHACVVKNQPDMLIPTPVDHSLYQYTVRILRVLYIHDYI